jgi:NAD(P)-dependent dehydrogenase (short-subunit alcohol dehydrogenase family)
MTNIPIDRGLAGKRAVVTGGASGIGLATVRRLTAEGVHVMIFDVNHNALEQVLQEEVGIVGGVAVDVGHPEEVSRAYEQVDAQLGGLDILVANAGISYRTPFLEITPLQWNQVLTTNLTGVFYTAQQAALRMVRNPEPGVILMTASTNGLSGHRYYADYNASKAGMILLARTMSLELAPKVRVNAVCPGYVLTAMQQAEYTAEMIEQVNKAIPLARHAAPEEIAALFAFLASNDAAYITGQTIIIDGGELA